MWRAVSLTLAVTAGATSCLPALTGPTEARRVVVVGDSVVAGAKADLDAALADTRHSVGGVAGIDLPGGSTLLVQPAVATDPDVLVVELGINDAHDGWSPAVDEVNLDAVLATVAGVDCVIWLLPDVLEPTALDADHGQTTTLHARIRRLWSALDARLPRHPNLHLDRFGTVQRTRPDWYQADGVHPNAAGNAALARHVVASIDEHCGA